MKFPPLNHSPQKVSLLRRSLYHWLHQYQCFILILCARLLTNIHLLCKGKKILLEARYDFFYSDVLPNRCGTLLKHTVRLCENSLFLSIILWYNMKTFFWLHMFCSGCSLKSMGTIGIFSKPPIGYNDPFHTQPLLNTMGDISRTRRYLFFLITVHQDCKVISRKVMNKKKW